MGFINRSATQHAREHEPLDLHIYTGNLDTMQAAEDEFRYAAFSRDVSAGSIARVGRVL